MTLLIEYCIELMAGCLFTTRLRPIDLTMVGAVGGEQG